MLPEEAQEIRNRRRTPVRFPRLCCHIYCHFDRYVGHVIPDFQANQISGLMKLKNNTDATTAETVSRTKTKPNDTRIRFTFGVTLGLAQRYPGTIRLSTSLPRIRVKLIPAATAESTLVDLAKVRAMGRSMAASCPGTRQNRISRSAIVICRKCTSFANATHPRNSIAQIISASISSIAMPGQAGSGPTCSRTRACLTKSLPRRGAESVGVPSLCQRV